MRALIESQLSTADLRTDPLQRTLADVRGQVTQAFLDFLNEPRSPAAVLVGLVDRPAGLTVLLTERAAHLKDHAGQVSFPGGRIESSDAGPIGAALREAEEEVGLRRQQVAVAGCLETLLTVTGFMVTPVVGFVAPEFTPEPDRTEVAEVFEVPLAYVLDTGNVRVSYRERLGSTLRVYELEYGGHRIWGATASMLMNFRSLIIDEKTKL